MIKRICATALLVGMFALMAFAVLPASPVGAQQQPEFGSVNLFTNVKVPGGAKQDIRNTIINLLNIILGFLGLIAVLIIIAAGFMWMTAGGNEKRLETARKLLIQGFIGLILILAAWGIAWFVVTTFEEQLLKGQ